MGVDLVVGFFVHNNGIDLGCVLVLGCYSRIGMVLVVS